VAFLRVVVAQDSREHDLVHVAEHGIFVHHLRGHLGHAHELEGFFTGGAFFLPDQFLFGFLALAVHFEDFCTLINVHAILTWRLLFFFGGRSDRSEKQFPDVSILV
jgi:hypothetical protein